jgi:hypothetical protein
MENVKNRKAYRVANLRHDATVYRDVVNEIKGMIYGVVDEYNMNKKGDKLTSDYYIVATAASEKIHMPALFFRLQFNFISNDYNEVVYGIYENTVNTRLYVYDDALMRIPVESMIDKYLYRLRQRLSNTGDSIVVFDVFEKNAFFLIRCDFVRKKMEKKMKHLIIREGRTVVGNICWNVEKYGGTWIIMPDNKICLLIGAVADDINYYYLCAHNYMPDEKDVKTIGGVCFREYWCEEGFIILKGVVGASDYSMLGDSYLKSYLNNEKEWLEGEMRRYFKRPESNVPFTDMYLTPDLHFKVH